MGTIREKRGRQVALAFLLNQRLDAVYQRVEKMWARPLNFVSDVIGPPQGFSTADVWTPCDWPSFALLLSGALQ